MKKFTKQHYPQLFNQCFAIDLIIKGIEPGNVEQRLTELVVQFHQ
jgi:hypothetical protein